MLCQTLYGDDGRSLIVRYEEDAPTYAWVGISDIRRECGGVHYFDARRLGEMSTDQAARAAVERALEQEVGS